jgi:hypothetical protein
MNLNYIDGFKSQMLGGKTRSDQKSARKLEAQGVNES